MVSVTANCSLVSVCEIPETACLTGFFESNEMIVQSVNVDSEFFDMDKVNEAAFLL